MYDEIRNLLGLPDNVYQNVRHFDSTHESGTNLYSSLDDKWIPFTVIRGGMKTTNDSIIEYPYITTAVESKTYSNIFDRFQGSGYHPWFKSVRLRYPTDCDELYSLYISPGMMLDTEKDGRFNILVCIALRGDLLKEFPAIKDVNNIINTDFVANLSNNVRLFISAKFVQSKAAFTQRLYNYFMKNYFERYLNYNIPVTIVNNVLTELTDLYDQPKFDSFSDRIMFNKQLYKLIHGKQEQDSRAQLGKIVSQNSSGSLEYTPTISEDFTLSLSEQSIENF